MYANDETEEPFEIGILEEDFGLKLDREYQSTPSTRFEAATVSQSLETADLPLRATLARILMSKGGFANIEPALEVILPITDFVERSQQLYVYISTVWP
jgi:hypothetical protein